jgi:methyltransferase (TIGR00027 family)
MVRWNVAIRTVIIDDFITSAMARGVDTVLSLGAGLDTRPYRLDLPAELSWIEVDYPEMIAFKAERLASESPRCHLERVGLDLADIAARREFLARVDAGVSRLLVLTEVVILHLYERQVATLADDLRALAHLDGWIVDYEGAPRSAGPLRWLCDPRAVRRAALIVALSDTDAYLARPCARIDPP